MCINCNGIINKIFNLCVNVYLSLYNTLPILESRLIYKVSHSISNIEWLNSTIENGAWIYIGADAYINKELILKSIIEHFTDDILFISLTRNGSKEVAKQNIEFEIEHILGKDFSIWDTKFQKVIEFDKNGVMRIGVTISSP